MWVGKGALVCAGLALWVWTLWVPVQAAWDPQTVQDDQRGWVSAFHRYHDRTVMQGEDWLLDGAETMAPPGYRWLLRLTARVAPPVPFTQWFGVAIATVPVLVLWRLGTRLLGPELGLAVFGLSAQAYVFIGRAAGGIHRSFGYPLITISLWALCTRRPAVAVWCAAGAALFYPPAGMVTATVAALLLVTQHPRFDVPARRQWTHAIVLGVLTLLVAAGWVRANRTHFGPMISFEAALHAPELQRDGGHNPLLPFLPVQEELGEALSRAFRRSWKPLPQPLLWAAISVVAVGALCAGRDWIRAFRPVWILGAVGIAWYLVARAIAFRLMWPDRSIKLTLPVCLLLAWAWAWRGIVRRVLPGAPPAVAAVCALVAGVGVAGTMRPPAEKSRVFAERLAPLTAVVSRLPGNAVLSGPPHFLDTLSATAHRRTFLSHELLLVQRPKAFARMRARYALHYAAYYGAGPEAVRRLRDEGPVDFLIVDRRNFTMVDYSEYQVIEARFRQRLWVEDLDYHHLGEPMNSDVRAVLAENPDRRFWLADPPRSMIAAEVGPLLVLDLFRLPEPA